MENKIVGRLAELQELKDIFNSGRAEFVAVYGRRRVGKTYIIETFFKKRKCVYFQAIGIQGGSMKEQLNNFMDALSEYFFDKTPLQAVESWRDAFQRLTTVIENRSKKEKIIIFLDELPWMATDKSNFLQNLDYFWNKYWSKMPNLKLIACGSSASWIIKKILNDTGGLHNRVTRQIILRPFTLYETKQYCEYMNYDFNTGQILEIYMAIGGIPFYLNNIKKNISITQNINNLCFRSNGLLFDEFNKLFKSLFKDAEAHCEIIRVIASKHYGIARSALEAQCTLSESGGTLTERLKGLEDAGFILSFVPYGHKQRGIFYRVIDEYTLFYLRWIEKAREGLIKMQNENNFWKNQYKSPSWHAWSGYAFEAACYKHIDAIIRTLKITGGCTASAWNYSPATQEDDGAQIDLVLDRHDDCITLCEIKFTDRSFEVNKAYAKNLTAKLETFKSVTKTKKQLFIALISANGIKEGIYADQLVSGVVTANDLIASN